MVQCCIPVLTVETQMYNERRDLVFPEWSEQTLVPDCGFWSISSTY